MASNVTLNNVTYSIPAEGDDGWGTVLAQYFIAISSSVLQKSGGSFALTAEANFGATHGLKSAYLKSQATNPSGTGIVRLGNAEAVSWRNAANSADLALAVNASNALQFNGVTLLGAGAASIIDADISAIAAIAHSKMAALTASRAMVTDGSGVASTSVATATEVGFLSGLLSSAVGVSDPQTITNKTVGDALLFTTGSEPAAPANGIEIYSVNNNGFARLQIKDNAGFVTTLARDNYFIARNTSGVSIPKGRAVYITGSTGNVANIAPARADSEDTIPAVGLTDDTIANNSFGRILSDGLLTGIDTSSFSEGDAIFVSATTAGLLTNVKPLHPNLVQKVGVVTRSHASTGSYEVETQTIQGRESGTIKNTFAVGDTLAGTKAIEFKNANTLSVQATPTANRTVTLPDATTQLVGRDTTDALTNKTLTAPVINSPTGLSKADVGLSNVDNTSDATKNAATVTLSNKTLTTPITDIISLTEQATTPAPPLSGSLKVYAKTDDKLYFLAPSGIEKQVGSGAGGGGINYIANPNGEEGTLGWAEYNDAAGAMPVDGTGGSPSGFIGITSTLPLRGTFSLRLAKDGVNRQGYGISYDFQIDRADRAKVLQISFDYTSTSSGTFEGGTSTTDSSVVVYIYDVTNNRLIQPAPFKLDGSVPEVPYKFNGTFQTSSDSVNYRLIFHVARTETASFTLKFDNVSVSPQVISTGGIATDWQSYTPTFTGFGTVSSVFVYSRRVGDTLEVQGLFVSGTPTATAARITLGYGGANGNVTVDSTKTLGVLGLISASPASATLFGGYAYSASGSVNYVTFGTQSSGATIPNSHPANGSSLVGTGTSVTFKFTVPIAGWGTSQVLSSETDTRRVYMVNGGNPTVTVNGTLAVARYPAAASDSHGSYSSSTGLYTVKVPGPYNVIASLAVTATYAANNNVTLAIYKNGAAVRTTLLPAGSSSITTLIPLITGKVECIAGDTIGIYVSSNATSPVIASGAFNFFDLNLDQGPAQIAASDTVAASAQGSSTSISGTAVDVIWTTEEYDYTGSFNGTSFSAPVSGLYEVAAGFRVNASGGTSGVTSQISITKGASTTVATGFGLHATTGTFAAYPKVFKPVRLLAGETIKIQLASDATGPAISGTASHSNFSIRRVGNY